MCVLNRDNFACGCSHWFWERDGCHRSQLYTNELTSSNPCGTDCEDWRHEFPIRNLKAFCCCIKCCIQRSVKSDSQRKEIGELIDYIEQKQAELVSYENLAPPTERELSKSPGRSKDQNRDHELSADEVKTAREQGIHDSNKRLSAAREDLSIRFATSEPTGHHVVCRESYLSKLDQQLESYKDIARELLQAQSSIRRLPHTPQLSQVGPLKWRGRAYGVPIITGSCECKGVAVAVKRRMC